MNERIKELWEEAVYSESLNSSVIEEFVELIVLDTMQVVANQLPSNVYLDVASAIIEHYKKN
jgi:hypothetical protein